MKNKEFQPTATPNSFPSEAEWKKLITQQGKIPSKVLDSIFTPKSGPIPETLAFLREKRAKGEISYEEALRISEQCIIDTRITQYLGFPVDDCIERPVDSQRFS